VFLQVTQRFQAPLAEVYRWCTDFQDTDPSLSRIRLRTRAVLNRRGGAVDMEETGVMGFPFAAKFHVDLRPPAAWDADGQSNMGRTHNTYRLSPEADATRLDMTFEIHLRGPYRLMGPFAHGFIRTRIAREWADYARAMETQRERRRGGEEPQPVS